MKKRQSPDEATNLLNDAVDTHFSALRGLPLSVEYFERLNPDFLLDIAKEYLALCPAKVFTPVSLYKATEHQCGLCLNDDVLVSGSSSWSDTCSSAPSLCFCSGYCGESGSWSTAGRLSHG